MNWIRIGAVMEKSWYSAKRDMFRLFDIFYWPVFTLIVWGLFASYITESSAPDMNLMSLIVGAVILWTFFDRASKDISLAMTDELWNRNFVNLFSTPLTIGEYLMGVTLVAIVKLAVSMTFMLILAGLMYGFQISSIGLYWIPAAAGLTILGWTVSLVVQGLILRYGHTVEIFIWAVTVLIQPLSCVFYPITVLPGWAQKIAWALPSTYLFENMRTSIAGQGIRLDQIAISFALNAVYFVLALSFFYRSFAHAKVRGNLVKLW